MWTTLNAIVARRPPPPLIEKFNKVEELEWTVPTLVSDIAAAAGLDAAVWCLQTVDPLPDKARLLARWYEDEITNWCPEPTEEEALCAPVADLVAGDTTEDEYRRILRMGATVREAAWRAWAALPATGDSAHAVAYGVRAVRAAVRAAQLTYLKEITE